MKANFFILIRNNIFAGDVSAINELRSKLIMPHGEV